MYTIFSIFTNRTDAESAINALEDAGFNPRDISIVMRDTNEETNIANNTGVAVGNSAATGIATGAVVGGLAGLLIGVGAIAVPGIGALLVAGPLASALGLTGAAAATVSGVITGAAAGGLIGALVGLGVPEEQARVYETRVREGGILLAIPVEESHVDNVREILEDYNADQIRSITTPRVRNQDVRNTEYNEPVRHHVQRHFT